MLSGLKALIVERFHPGQYIPMILVFTLANALYFQFLGLTTLSVDRLILTFVLMLSAFFRLRLFDEIKDYETDLKVNPTRPLARGALSITQTKKAILFCIVLEIILAGFLGLSALLIHGLCLFYSILMFEEFFIGDFLRPHLTTYAVTHTFVSVLLGISAAISASGVDVLVLQGPDFIFFLMNWCFFNLFEFARKSYWPSEERKGVDTYSSLFGTLGAGLLSLSQVILGIALVFLSVKIKQEWLLLALTLILVGPLLGYLYSPQNKINMAKTFRSFTGLYLLAHYACLVWIFWR